MPTSCMRPPSMRMAGAGAAVAGCGQGEKNVRIRRMQVSKGRCGANGRLGGLGTCAACFCT